MIETLFIVKTPTLNPKEMTRRPVLPSQSQENRVLDPKKSQNIAILLRALNVTVEEVCEALLEGILLLCYVIVMPVYCCLITLVLQKRSSAGLHNTELYSVDMCSCY